MLKIGLKDGGYAVNVKYYAGFPEKPVEDDRRQALWEETQTEFFRKVRNIAHSLGYAGIFVIGRSGGWVQPYWQNGHKFEIWPGQGGALGYPQYVQNADDPKFRKFHREVNKLFTYFVRRLSAGLWFTEGQWREVGNLSKPSQDDYANCIADFSRALLDGVGNIHEAADEAQELSEGKFAVKARYDALTSRMTVEVKCIQEEPTSE